MLPGSIIGKIFILFFSTQVLTCDLDIMVHPVSFCVAIASIVRRASTTSSGCMHVSAESLSMVRTLGGVGVTERDGDGDTSGDDEAVASAISEWGEDANCEQDLLEWEARDSDRGCDIGGTLEVEWESIIEAIMDVQ